MAAPMLKISPPIFSVFAKNYRQIFQMRRSIVKLGNLKTTSFVKPRCHAPKLPNYAEKSGVSGTPYGYATVHFCSASAVCKSSCQHTSIEPRQQSPPRVNIHPVGEQCRNLSSTLLQRLSSSSCHGPFFFRRNVHTTQSNSQEDDRVPKETDDPDYKPPWRKDERSLLRLSSWSFIIWPNLLKTIKNWFLTFLIRGYLDETYSTKTFLNGAEQAVTCVSNMISSGHFDELRGLVDEESIAEAQVHYADLNVAQREIIQVKAGDIFFRYIYEIGMIFDDITEKRFVEITTVFQGCPGLGAIRESDPLSFQSTITNNPDKLYICNYRFIKEFTKGVEDSWTINKLNHFHPKEVAENTPPFSR